MDIQTTVNKDGFPKQPAFWKGQTFYTLVLAIILLLFMGSLRPDQSLGLYPNEYWALKAQWRHCADIVLAGDSRVLIGLSPAEMNTIFKGRRIYNYGFGGAWFSKEYLDAVENLLDPNSKDRTIVLAITPHSLTKRLTETGNFFEVLYLSEQDKFMNIHFAGIMYFFEPLSFKEALEGLIPDFADSYTTRTYYEDGWISVHKEPLREKREIKKYRGFYMERQVTQENVSRVLEYVTRWKSQGIKVFGLLFPSCEEMYELEKEMSGFNEKEFVSRFKEIGGAWIDVKQTSYDSFDGSHLQDDGAIAFSKVFSERLLEEEQKAENEEEVISGQQGTAFLKNSQTNKEN